MAADKPVEQGGVVSACRNPGSRRESPQDCLEASFPELQPGSLAQHLSHPRILALPLSILYTSRPDQGIKWVLTLTVRVNMEPEVSL